MRTPLRAVLGATLVALSCAVAPAPADATVYGVVLDVSSFTGSIPPDFTGSSDFSEKPCEFERYSSVGDHWQHIYSAWNDTCSADTETYGAPGPGDVSIYQRFSASADQYYKAWAIGRMHSPNNARAQVKIIFRDASNAIGECYGRTESTSFVTFSSGPYTAPNTRSTSPEMSLDGGCKAPSGTSQVVVHYRIHSGGAQAHGSAVLSHLRFGRCYDTGVCTNVPAPTSSA